MFLCEIKESNREKPRETIKLTLNIFLFVSYKTCIINLNLKFNDKEILRRKDWNKIGVIFNFKKWAGCQDYLSVLLSYITAST